eukprot:jgi/Tetstr1/454848/TSEL_000326.t1
MASSSGPVEWEYYTNQKKSVAWFNPDLFVHCVGQLGAGRRHKDLQDVYRVVLPIREACELKADGLKHIVRRLKPNGQQRLKNLDKHLTGKHKSACEAGTRNRE